MALIATIDLEGNNLSEFNGNSGTGSVVASPTYHGSFALQVPFQAAGYHAKDLAPTLAQIYIRFAFQYHITTFPSVSSPVEIFHTNAIGGISIVALYLVTPTSGDSALRMDNNFTPGTVGSPYTISPDTWYTVDIQNRIGSSTTLELRVNDVVRATSATQNTGTTNLDGAIFRAGGVANGLVGNAYFDWILLDNAAYQSYAPPPPPVYVYPAWRKV